MPFLSLEQTQTEREIERKRESIEIFLSRFAAADTVCRFADSMHAVQEEKGSGKNPFLLQ